MSEFYPPVPSSKRTSVRVQSKMFSDIEKSMILNGYHFRERSKWISDALIRLEKTDDYVSLVRQEYMSSGGEAIPIVIGVKAMQSLEKMIEATSEVLPKNNDLQSKILRTSIIQFLLEDTS